jgi:hypothetical protein
MRPEASVTVPEIMIGSASRAVPRIGLDREQRGLGIQRVEDGLDQQQVGAAVDQAAGLLAVGLDQLVEGDVARARVVDVGRDRRGLGVGPSAPATKRGRRIRREVGRGGARESAASTFIS